MSMPASSRRSAPAHPPHHPARRTALAAASALALAGSVTATPALASAMPATSQRSTETPSETTVTDVDVVTLATGDRVRLTTYSDRRASAVVLRGSPHAGAPVKILRTVDSTYVMPRLPLRAQRIYDTSLFNVSALAAMRGTSVPVTITFGPGVTPHAVPGFTLDTADAQPAIGGGTVVGARYSAATKGSTPAAINAWRGVTSVALPAGVHTPHTAGKTRHTLTIHVVNLKGDPVKYEVAYVQNVDDARVFVDQVEIVDGAGSIPVPEGNYAVFAGTFTRTVIDPDFAVRKDTSISMSLADATVRPSEALPTYGVADAGVTLQRDATRGGGIGVLLQSDRFVFRVQPVAARPPHGTMHTSVSAAHAPSDELPPTGDVFSTLAYTKDFRSGVPNDLAFTHPKSDFAAVPQKFYANGPAAVHTSDAIGFAPYEIFSFGTEFPVRVPSQRTIRLLGSPGVSWEQDYQPTNDFGPKPAYMYTIRRYTPGKALPVSFAHGPVGPGVEAGYDTDNQGPFCRLCRVGNHLRGVMPLFSGAGTGMSGVFENPDMGSWSLKRDGTVVDSGDGVLAPDVTLPAASHTYTLEAASHPGVKSWQLSTDVTDIWTFTSAAGNAVIPLLMPSYVPRIALDGSLAAGPTKLPLDFGNLGPVDAAVTKATVELSTDGGKHWTDATVTRADKNSFAVTYTNPAASGSVHTMSMRVTGVDTAGRRVTETALDVYNLVA